ncbi:MAG: hypothetical protein JXA37_00815 [Chloroflexia bacterium]|nr:hypothetical protein [Chloroflexia bacterium]
MEHDSRRVDLLDNYDVVVARQTAREMARDLGFGLTDQARIATAVSEVARQALRGQGLIIFSYVIKGLERGLECTCEGCAWDKQGGAALAERGILGGIERLMDDFEATVGPEKDIVVMRKWRSGD